ncbi:hypothetical protein T492DRAFT_525797 [Pavlovales sp. CCMP2436]|nr:hypothetical protein T492DRAFT_525797 [Pavlovales sp. CCMP2436]
MAATCTVHGYYWMHGRVAAIRGASRCCIAVRELSPPRAHRLLPDVPRAHRHGRRGHPRPQPTTVVVAVVNSGAARSASTRRCYEARGVVLDWWGRRGAASRSSTCAPPASRWPTHSAAARSPTSSGQAAEVAAVGGERACAQLLGDEQSEPAAFELLERTWVRSGRAWPARPTRPLRPRRARRARSPPHDLSRKLRSELPPCAPAAFPLIVNGLLQQLLHVDRRAHLLRQLVLLRRTEKVLGERPAQQRDRRRSLAARAPEHGAAVVKLSGLGVEIGELKKCLSGHFDVREGRERRDGSGGHLCASRNRTRAEPAAAARRPAQAAAAASVASSDQRALGRPPR